MATAREIMHNGAECVRMNDTLVQTARRMRELNVGAMPICGDDDRLQGIITDRDIVIRCIAEGGDPTTVTAGDLANGTPIWVDADAEEQEVVRLLSQHKIRRLPVMEQRRLIGIISEADVATRLPEEKVAEFARAIYSAPPSA
jgi:CBS domain-containing protein